MKRIQGTLHRIRTFQKFVKFLKRYILDDSINSLAYFYKDIESQ